MSEKIHLPASAKAEFMKKVKGLYPVAKGALSLVRKPCAHPDTCPACKCGDRHPAWIYVFRQDGKLKCLHVQPRHVEFFRTAIENGRKLESLILEEGLEVLRNLRDRQ